MNRRKCCREKYQCFEIDKIKTILKSENNLNNDIRTALIFNAGRNTT